MDEAFSALDPLIRREMQEQLVVQDVDRARVLTAASVMEPPHATMPLSAGVRGALRTMRAQQTGALFAVENRRLVGVVTDRAVIRAVKAGETDLRRVVDASPRALPTVGPDDLLTDIVETAAGGSPTPGEPATEGA